MNRSVPVLGLPDVEHGNIVAAAQGNSIRAGREKNQRSTAGEPYEDRLAQAPTVEQLKSHLAILSELARSHGNMGGDFDADAEQLMIAWCQDVADAAGGLLGLRSARHDAEHAALKTIAAAVDVRNAKHWRAFLGQASGA